MNVRKWRSAEKWGVLRVVYYVSVDLERSVLTKILEHDSHLRLPGGNSANRLDLTLLHCSD